MAGFFAAFARATDDHVHVVDADGSIVWANPSALAAVDLWNILPAGQAWGQGWPVEQRPKAVAAIRTALEQGHAWFMAHMPTRAGTQRHWSVALTRISGVRDAGDFVIAVTRECGLRHVDAVDSYGTGDLDGLTGLPNAVWFHRELSSRTGGATRCQRPLALVMIDLDDFKQFNSRLGPQACDAMLARFADLLAQAAGTSTFLARSGGDEFALIVDDAADPAAVSARIAYLILRCADQISGPDHPANFSVSAGISFFPADAASDQELLRNAHTALRAAKGAGRGRCVRFDGGMRQQLQRHSSMLEVARAAIAGGWMRPYYQPKIDLTSGRVTGLEALLRWQSPDGTVHTPASISAAFDDPEIATRITDIMLRKVVADLMIWRRMGSAVPVAINVSGADFRDTQFARRFLRQLREAGVPADLVELEVTEGVFLGVGAEEVGVALRKLNAAGVRIALDDFGTGYASLTHLKQHPVDLIKIDRSFVSNLAASPDDRAIVGAMISLGRNLAIEVVAEGIETEEQVLILRDFGCHTGQGFLFSRAVPGSEIPDIVREQKIGSPISAARASILATGSLF
nr:EAL domain-containing protein [Sphingomonas bacterium]